MKRPAFSIHLKLHNSQACSFLQYLSQHCELLAQYVEILLSSLFDTFCLFLAAQHQSHTKFVNFIYQLVPYLLCMGLQQLVFPILIMFDCLPLLLEHQLWSSCSTHLRRAMVTIIREDWPWGIISIVIPIKIGQGCWWHYRCWCHWWWCYRGRLNLSYNCQTIQTMTMATI